MQILNGTATVGVCTFVGLVSLRGTQSTLTKWCDLAVIRDTKARAVDTLDVKYTLNKKYHFCVNCVYVSLSYKKVKRQLSLHIYKPSVIIWDAKYTKVTSCV